MHEENFGKRSEILRKIQPLMEGTDRRLIDNLVRENRALYRIPLNSNAESLRLFRRMVAFCVETISGRDGADVSPLRVECRPPRPSSEDHVIVNRLQSVCPGVRLIAGGPWPQLPLNPFDFQLFSAPVYLIESELGPEELRALRACHGDNFGNKAVLLVRDDSRFILTSVNSDLVDHWGSFQGSSDLLHLLLSGRPGKAVTELHRQRIEARLRAFREQLSAALADPQFGRMDPAMFPLFLFNALRVLIFNRELGRGRWRWLLTPAEITDFLLNETPLRPSFPRALAEQFERVTKEGARFNERLMPKSRMLLAEMMEIASSGGPLEALSKLNDVADEQRLSISAAIVTANRPAQLARCLDSLARLTRPPEELIVVNNGFDATTRKSVENACMPFPVRYLECGQTGVAPARNMAVRESRGEIVAFIDDDASVEPGWLEMLERVFLRDPQIGLASGSILNMQCGRTDKISKFMEAVEKL